MKKIFIISLISFILLISVSCGDSSKNSGDTESTDNDTAYTGDDSTNTGDDSAETETDADSTDVENTDNDSNTTESECTGVSFDNLELSTQYAGYAGISSEQFGDPTVDDLFAIQFYKEDYSDITELTVGTYDLAEGLNSNYATCLECVLFYEDWDGSGGTTYFQESGTLTISEIKSGTLESKGIVSAKLIEVTIAGDDYTSTPVEGGGCYEIEAAAWDNICVPDCEGKICGSDGCNGTCGDGCSTDQGCNAEGTACIDYDCTEITIGTASLVDVMESENYWSYTADYEPSTGETTNDEIFIQLLAAPEADTSFDLANTNYSDSDQRILALEDPVYNAGGTLTGLGKMYFQQRGTISFESFDSATGNIKATITNLRLVEVTMEQGTYISTPVNGGTCLELANGTIEIQ